MRQGFLAFVRILDWPWSVWGGLYLLCIPLFAAIFTFALPARSFFHSTLQHEPEVKNRFADALHHLSDDYSEARQYDASCQQIAFSSHVEDDSLRIDGDDISFSIRYSIGPSSKNEMGYRVVPRVHFSVQRSFDIPRRLPPGKGRGKNYKELHFEGLPEYPLIAHVAPESTLVRCLFPAPYNDQVSATTVLFGIAASHQDELEELAYITEGFPPQDADEFWRMLYLSTSTITTSGFGDIVPLTRTARIAVTGESIVGVLIVGMLLNALSRRNSTQTSTVK